MLNQNQNQNQSSFQPLQDNQPINPYSNSQINEQNQPNSNYQSSKQYQSQMDYRNNSNRERSRSRDHNQRRQSFPEYSQGNNYNMNNRNNKSYYYRNNNDRQFDINRYKQDQFRENYNDRYNQNNGPTKDDCLIVLPKNFFNFIEKDFDKIKNDLKRELKNDIYNINYNYSIQNIPEKIFRFTTNYSNSYPFKAKAIKIISDFLFNIMKQQYDNTTYLKLLFLIPDNVIGNLIGIQGKNINQLREETNATIEVFSPSASKKYRKVEVAGVPQSIAEAGERICAIARKFYYFHEDKLVNRNEHSPKRERDNWDRDRYEMNNYNERTRRERYYEGNWNREYKNQGFNGDKEYKGMFSKERNDYKDMGYKNDYKNRDGYRNYNSRDNNNYFRDNNRDYRDNNNQRFRNNYDRRNNNKYYNDKNLTNEDIKNNDNWSNKSFSRKSLSKSSRENQPFNNFDNNEDWPEEKNLKNEENKGDNNGYLYKQQNYEDNKNEIEFMEKRENENYDNLNEKNNSIKDEIKENPGNENINDFSNNNNNNIGVSNIENNNLNNINYINKEINENIKENGEIEDIYKELRENLREKDKSSKIIIYLSSEEINLLNNSENDNFLINLGNAFQCNISKISKIIDNQEIVLIEFNGSPKQNTLAIYQLQKYFLNMKNEQIESNKSDN